MGGGGWAPRRPANALNLANTISLTKSGDTSIPGDWCLVKQKKDRPTGGLGLFVVFQQGARTEVRDQLDFPTRGMIQILPNALCKIGSTDTGDTPRRLNAWYNKVDLQLLHGYNDCGDDELKEVVGQSVAPAPPRLPLARRGDQAASRGQSLRLL